MAEPPPQRRANKQTDNWGLHFDPSVDVNGDGDDDNGDDDPRVDVNDADGDDDNDDVDRQPKNMKRSLKFGDNRTRSMSKVPTRLKNNSDDEVYDN